MDFTAIFVTGFFVLGTYKIIELFVRKNERIAMIEKFASLANPESTGPIHLPNISFEKQDLGSWTLRLSLLLIGIGVGSLCAVLLQYSIDSGAGLKLNWNQIGMINFAFISFFGGLGLFIAFLIELFQRNKQSKRDNQYETYKN